MDVDHQLQLLLAAYQEQMARLAPVIQQNLDNARAVAATIDWGRVQTVTAQLAAHQRELQEALAPAFTRLQEALVQLPPRMTDALLTLGQHGWYMDPHIGFDELWEFEAALADGNVVEAEEGLCQYFEARLDRIESSICARFPDRARFFHLAFAAHRRGEFALSIPLLLAQTDGICQDVIDEQLYGRRNGKPRTAEFVEGLEAGSLRAALLAPLTQLLPIAANDRERGVDFDELNRHTVLHGESLDYDTRVNALKAVSLANYIATVLGREPSRNL